MRAHSFAATSIPCSHAVKHMIILLFLLCPVLAHAAQTASMTLGVTVQVIGLMMPPQPVRDYYIAQPTSGIVYRTIEY